MCGIVGAIAERDVGKILLMGLQRLEYRGYDSAGISIINHQQQLQRLRTVGKISELRKAFNNNPLTGNIGIAHTRWATHGKPTKINAHPHQSGNYIAIVHNGIIENYEQLREKLLRVNYTFQSDTDTETIAHLIHYELSKNSDFLVAVKNAVKQLQGAFAIGIINSNDPNRLIAVRYGSPLVIGLGIGENFIASDNLALLPITQNFIFLEEGDIAEITRDKITIFDAADEIVTRKAYTSESDDALATRGKYKHFMLKEIFDQTEAIQSTLEGRINGNKVFIESFGIHAKKIFPKIKHIQIVACGTSYHAALVAKYWIEQIANIPCQVDTASEYRYRQNVVLPNTLFITISQSGETADTLAALKKSKTLNYLASLTICNAPESSLVRLSDLTFMTRAGKEIGVASTKAYTAQLVALLLFTLALTPALDEEIRKKYIHTLKTLPEKIAETLQLHPAIQTLAKIFTDKKNALFLGRNTLYPTAMEGALKLKEISYIHAEAYPAGELKHGPLALIDPYMPVIIVAPTNELLEKMKSNIQEIRARGGILIVFTDKDSGIQNDTNLIRIQLPRVDDLVAPILYTIPLQFLAYDVALIKGTDVDHPRNLAKSVTVE